MGLFIGGLLVCWVFGWCGGLMITQLRRFFDQV